MVTKKPSSSASGNAAGGLAAAGLDPNTLAQIMAGLSSPAGGLSTAPLTGSKLVAALAAASSDVYGGRSALTGSPFTGALPTWAQNLPQDILSSPDYDPYYGVLSQKGDERVLMGQDTSTTTEPGLTPRVQMLGAGEVAGVDGPVPTTDSSSPHKVTEKSDRAVTVAQALNMPYTWSQKKIDETMKQMRAAGIPVESFDGTGASGTSLISAWQSLVERAANIYDSTQGSKKVTPWDVLDMYKSEAQAAGNYQNYNQYLNRSQTTTSTNISDISEGQAWSALQQTLSTMLGRDPSDQELRDYAYRMNQMAAKNPSVTKTITQYKNGQAVGSTSHTDPGFTSSDMLMQAYQQAQNDPGYAEYQAASTFYNAALSALGPIGGGTG